MIEPFALDLASNPHPRLLALLLDQKARARSATAHVEQAKFLFGVRCCAAATGCEDDEILAWVARHEGRS